MKKAAATSKTEQARAAPGRKPIFRREHVIKAALDLMDRSGHEALSMRAIAAELGGGVATLYNYFESLADLNDELAVTLLGGIPLLDAKSPQQTRQQLKDMVITYAAVIERHPDINQMIGPRASQRVLQLLNSALRAMVDGGVDIQRAGIMWSILQGIAQSHAMSSRGLSIFVREPQRYAMVKDLDAVMMLADAGYVGASIEERFSLVLDVIFDRIVPELKAKAKAKAKASGR
ncbi:MAG: TetR/AcrR family transcriptional regulator [Pseudomonadota bacterium]|nr:TetR/AcrR family transcriptional regulator [Pseudomonadota bacterium]